ncbi:hypothetical protein ZIOFF_075816 [Zingiber officinale]|uniref:Uncharacterized protein n=1 Tax=Zingiber officinale TaxID=94328 RepID=A0A8J5CPT0_ZINOF|nr:hypothetical protein ZIOFF_075816 [Zingiber officinale]
MDFSWPEPEPATDYVGRRPLLTTVRHSDLLQRQTYLRSYQFTVRETFKGRVRRNLKEASKVGKAIVAEIIGRLKSLGKVFVSAMATARGTSVLVVFALIAILLLSRSGIRRVDAARPMPNVANEQRSMYEEVRAAMAALMERLPSGSSPKGPGH